jgi:two-component system phosphate regulon sensor histidine kinase PhoR
VTDANRDLAQQVQALTAELTAVQARLNQEMIERRRAETALRQSQTLLRVALDALAEAIQVMTPDGRIVLTNRTFDQWVLEFGIESQALGRTPFEIFPFLNDQVRAEYQRAFAGETVITQEATLAGPVEISTETAKIPVIEHGLVAYVITVIRDVTTQKRAEAETLQATLEKERSQLLANFIRDASHEFGNPLSVIKTALYLLAQPLDPARHQRHLTSISGQISHLERLVRGLLSMMQLDQQSETDGATASVNAVVTTAYQGLATAIEQRTHQVELDLADDLPPVSIDPRYLHQAITELLRNAITFTPPGGTITLCTAVQDRDVLIEVRDTGMGISAADLPHIFERFFRVDRARAERGAGLGLPIARQIIEGHQGRIEVESFPGQGTTFRIFLPIPTG